MVQFLLGRRRTKFLLSGILLNTLGFMSAGPCFGGGKDKIPNVVNVPELLLPGGRKLTFERSISDQRDVQAKKGFWKKVLDVVAGDPYYHKLVRPYGVVSDSHGRIIVSDPGAKGIHIFDFAAQKYKFISRIENKEAALVSPQCITVDAQDNIYVTDSESGMLFVFRADGRFERVIGSLKNGEGYFKRPTGVAVDSVEQRIYVTDTLRNKILVMDMKGSVLKTIGKGGTAQGEFNFPTELLLQGDNLLAVDAMNFRVQVFRKDGAFQYAIGQPGDGHGMMFRPKGIGMDSEGHVYVVDGVSSLVQVFDKDGNLLYYFGKKGIAVGDFQLPAGLFIDSKDHVFVADMQNRRIQEFHYFGAPGPAGARP